MQEIIQTYIPSTVKTCIDVGIPFGVYDHTWTRLFPKYATIELFRKEYGTTCFRIKGGTGLGAIMVGVGQTTCDMMREVVTRVELPAVFILNGDRTLESTVSSDTCRMYVGTLNGFVCPTLQDELNCVPNGSYVVVLNPTSSTYTSDTMQTIYSSDTVIILYLPLPEPEPVLEVVLPEPEPLLEVVVPEPEPVPEVVLAEPLQPEPVSSDHSSPAVEYS